MTWSWLAVVSSSSLICSSTTLFTSSLTILRLPLPGIHAIVPSRNNIQFLKCEVLPYQFFCTASKTLPRLPLLLEGPLRLEREQLLLGSSLACSEGTKSWAWCIRCKPSWRLYLPARSYPTINLLVNRLLNAWKSLPKRCKPSWRLYLPTHSYPTVNLLVNRLLNAWKSLAKRLKIASKTLTILKPVKGC